MRKEHRMKGMARKVTRHRRAVARTWDYISLEKTRGLLQLICVMTHALIILICLLARNRVDRGAFLRSISPN